MTPLRAAQVQRGLKLQVPEGAGEGLDPQLALFNCKKETAPQKNLKTTLAGHWLVMKIMKIMKIIWKILYINNDM